MNTFQYLLGKARRSKIEKKPLYSNTPPPAPVGENINTIAVILDGEVQEMLSTLDRMAALFLSEPTFALVPKDLDAAPQIGWAYKDGTFSPPTAQA